MMRLLRWLLRKRTTSDTTPRAAGRSVSDDVREREQMRDARRRLNGLEAELAAITVRARRRSG